MKKVILYLIKQKPFTEDFPAWPEIVGVYNKYLPKLEYDVWWIAPSPEVDEPTIKKWENVTLYLIPFDNSSMVKEFTSQIRFAILAIKFLNRQLKENNDKNVIVQVRDSAEAAIGVLFLKSQYKDIPMVLNYSFLFYEGVKEALKEGRVSILKFLYWWLFYNAILYRILRYFDLILPISREMKLKFTRELGIPEKKQVPFPLGVDPEVFYRPTEEEKERIRRSIGLSKNDVIFLYTGSISKNRRVSVFVRSLIPVLKKYKTAKLVLIGRGDELEDIKRITKKEKVEHKIVYKGWLHKEEVPKYYKMSDIGISIPKPAPQNFVMSPCKLFEYLGSGLVVIANPEIPEQKRVISGSKGGVLIEWNDVPAELPRVADNFISSPKLRRKMAMFGFRHVTKNKTFKRYSEKLDRIYRSMIEVRG